MIVSKNIAMLAYAMLASPSVDAGAHDLANDQLELDFPLKRAKYACPGYR